MKNNAYFVSGTKQASSKIIDAWSEKLFLWLALHRARLLKDNKEPGVQHTNSLAATEQGTWLLAASGKHGLSLYSLSFGLFGYFA